MDDPQRLTILYTNDVHSHFDQMPKIAAAFRLERNAFPESPTLILDVGDHMDFAYMMTEATRGLANVAAMNASGYEMATLGNNEALGFAAMDFTPEHVSVIYGEQAHFHVIASNVFDMQTEETPAYFLPHQVVNKEGLRIGLIGLTILTPQCAPFYRQLGWEVHDPLKIAAHYVNMLRERVDLIVVLSHLGLRKDREMAEEIPGIDVILGGHTHHILEMPEKVGETYICAAGKYGEHVGVLRLEYSRQDRHWITVEGRCIKVDPLPPDPDVAEVVRYHREQSLQTFGQVVTELSEALTYSWYAESGLGNLLASGLRKWAKADIGLVNAGQLTGGLDVGVVTRAKLMEICPWRISPCRVLLHGADILTAVEEALLEEIIHDKPRGFGFRGKKLGVLCMDGMTVKYDKTSPPHQRVLEVRIGDRLLQPERTYVAGTITYLALGKGYTSLGRGQEIDSDATILLRDVLEEELRHFEGNVDCNRWIDAQVYT